MQHHKVELTPWWFTFTIVAHIIYVCRCINVCVLVCAGACVRVCVFSLYKVYCVYSKPPRFADHLSLDYCNDVWQHFFYHVFTFSKYSLEHFSPCPWHLLLVCFPCFCYMLFLSLPICTFSQASNDHWYNLIAVSWYPLSLIL